jgi:DNA-binding response OmpR family regulator
MYKILIVDDDKVNGTQLQKRLEKREFECTFVESGEECLKKLKDNEFDCLLLDIMMPGLSGIDVLKKIREEKNNFELPIIMVTSRDQTEDIVEALHLKANDYIQKPVNIEVAIARIGTQIKLKELFNESIKGKQLQTINTMITTLNHEINNPLAVAIGNLTILKVKEENERIDKSLNALERITDIVKKIEHLVENQEVNENQYSPTISMFDLSDKSDPKKE